ncbi:MAG TPA: LuxR C-terminal-related transcriptional regulator [Nakamurella sp.]
MSSSSAHDQFVGLLRLRASPPAVPAAFVRRPRLENRLTDAVAHPVTLVSAGPGYGKTLTLASWIRLGSAPGVVAWLTLDETDNDLQAFWSDVLGALTIGGALPSDSALREVVPAAGFGAREAHRVRAGLAELPALVTLVLDDFQHVGDRRVLESFGQLLEHQPPELRVVLAARADPALRLNRLRVSGELTDIRADDLAFTATEAAELLDRSGIQLSAHPLGLLLDRIQGWAAGLRMAVMCRDPAGIDGGFSRFTGSERLVAEYLIEEVIDQLPEHERQFLLATSVADRLSAGLADAVTGHGDAQLILERLVARNALIVGLAGQNTWFTVHPLLRELLRHRLALEQPGTVTELHLRASRWFAAQGEPITAIRHASAAQHWDEVGRLLTGLALPQLLTTSGPALVSALGPAAARARVDPTASTLLAVAVCHFQRHDYEPMVRAANAAAELLADVPEGDRPAADVLIALVRLAHSRTRNPATTPQSAARLLDLLDRVPRRQLPAIEQYRVLAATNAAVGQLWTGDLDEAEAQLHTVDAQCRLLGLGLTLLSVQAHLALLDVIHGRLPDAYRRASAAREIAEQRGWTSEPQALGLYAALAMTNLEWNQLDAAKREVDSGLTVSDSGSDPACQLVLAMTAVGIAVARHDHTATRAAADSLDAIEEQAGELPPLLARWCAVAHADAHLIAGEPGAAIDRLGHAREPSGFADALERVVRAKAHLLLDQPEAALDLLDPVAATAMPYRGAVVESKILAAVAADRLHRDTAAMAAITEAVDLAQSVSMVRAFLAAGPRVAALIARHRHIVARHLEFTRELTPAVTNHEPIDTGPPPVDALTERELAVLTYLPTMFKAPEIAADLFVSVNTVKTHQRSIYRKLGVTTRRDAVDRARAMRLL